MGSWRGWECWKRRLMQDLGQEGVSSAAVSATNLPMASRSRRESNGLNTFAVGVEQVGHSSLENKNTNMAAAVVSSPTKPAAGGAPTGAKVAKRYAILPSPHLPPPHLHSFPHLVDPLPTPIPCSGCWNEGGRGDVGKGKRNTKFMFKLFRFLKFLWPLSLPFTN